jgi:hypothetical protein
MRATLGFGSEVWVLYKGDIARLEAAQMLGDTEGYIYIRERLQVQNKVDGICD